MANDSPVPPLVVQDTNERRPRPGVQIIRDQFKDMASFTRLQASGSSGVLIAAGENIGVDTVMPLLISNGN